MAVSVYIFSITKFSKDEIMETINQIPSSPVKEKIMSTYQIIKEEGKIEVVLNAHANGLSLALIANITGLDESEVTRILSENGKL